MRRIIFLIPLLAAFAAAAVVVRRARARPEVVVCAPSWAQAAGDEFAALSDAERCDLIFALAALDDEDSRRLLVRALDDPSEAVALAAARGLARHGVSEPLERYLLECSNERARTLRLLVEILD